MGAGVDCLSAFHGLLAFENERPAVFAAVHHLTVPAFYLQHPRGYRPQTLELWRTAISELLDGRMTPNQLRARMSEAFGGSAKVRDAAADVPSGWPRTWSTSVIDVFDVDSVPDADDYIASAMRWAAAVREDLDRALMTRKA
jgi:hypothetical protein